MEIKQDGLKKVVKIKNGGSTKSSSVSLSEMQGFLLCKKRVQQLVAEPLKDTRYGDFSLGGTA